MTTHGYIGRMFLVSCVFVGYIMFFIKGIPVTAISVSQGFGGGTGLIFLPALVVIPWRRFQSKYGKEKNRPFYVGLAVFLSFCLGYFVDVVGL
jgi:hypothetical protein